MACAATSSAARSISMDWPCCSIRPRLRNPMAQKNRRPLRLILLSALAGAIVLAILYLRCGPGGFGIGGGKGDSVGKGDDAKKGLVATDAGMAGPAAKPACKVRLDAVGVSLDGKPTTIGD